MSIVGAYWVIIAYRKMINSNPPAWNIFNNFFFPLIICYVSKALMCNWRREPNKNGQRRAHQDIPGIPGGPIHAWSIVLQQSNTYFVFRNWNLRQSTRTWWRARRDTRRYSFSTTKAKWRYCRKTTITRRKETLFRNHSFETISFCRNYPCISG